MQSMASVAHRIQKILAEKRAASSQAATMTNSRGSLEKEVDKCPECKGMGYLIAEDGWTVLLGPDNRPLVCKCQKQKLTKERMRAAMIPDEFVDAELDNYEVTNPAQETLYNAIISYLNDFEQLMGVKAEERSRQNSIGFIAKFGEQKFKMIRDYKEQAQAKRMHNNFGLGKTHLQVAAAKELIKRGHSVLIVSDVVLMDELMMAKRADDQGASYFKLLGQVINAQVLVWDDIGKSSPSEARKSTYFQIINERYKARRPILFSSNEDVETLGDRIGDGALSRLLGMSRGRLYRVEGPDYRLTGGVQ